MHNFSTEEGLEKLMEIIGLQSNLIERLMEALGQFEEFDKELQRIDRMKEELED